MDGWDDFDSFMGYENDKTRNKQSQRDIERERNRESI